MSYVIYHANCMDGLFAATAAWISYGETATYIPLAYNEYQFDTDTCTMTVSGTSDDISSGGETWNRVYNLKDANVYILDFSFPRPVMDSLLENTFFLSWLDHHKTAFEMWDKPVGKFVSKDPDRYYIYLDNDKSGALLAWEYFQPHTAVPDLILNIDDRDRWQWKKQWSAEIHAALLARMPLSVEDAAALTQSYEYARLIAEGGSILRSAAALQESIRKNKKPCCILGSCGLSVNSPVYQSEIGNTLAKECGTYGLAWYLDSAGLVKVSLRSIGDYDVSEVAKYFGGGGHKNAAGFTCTAAVLLSFLAL